jgi:hypothetical protein
MNEWTELNGIIIASNREDSSLQIYWKQKQKLKAKEMGEGARDHALSPSHFHVPPEQAP